MALRKKGFPKRIVSFVLAAAMLLPSSLPTVKAEDTQEGFSSSKVLDLSFNDNLEDTSGNEFHGTARGNGFEYVEGKSGHALKLTQTENTYIDLGTSEALQPEDLTVSFWINPNEGLSSEHVIAWNKKAYNNEGWYLSSKNDTDVLVLSVGSASGQPVEYIVKGDRESFFPENQWTHIVVAFNSKITDTEKKVTMYKNGEKQTVVNNNFAANANGVIISDETVEKSIGYNGSVHHNGYAKYTLDEYKLFSQAATEEEAITLFEEFGDIFDKEAAVNADFDEIELPKEATENLVLPTTGSINGSELSWTSSNEDVLANDGTLTRPTAEEGDEEVTLTVTGTVQGSEAFTREFDVTVKAMPEVVLDPLAEDQVLNLKFEDNLNDDSKKENNGTAKGTGFEYVEGKSGQALKLTQTEKTYIDLGTSEDLQPENLTASFWIKPESSFYSGEHIITWNKNNYYEDGWYLSAQNSSLPLVFSIGSSSSTGQPLAFRVNPSIEGNRETFFPVGEWTHIAVTFDRETKEGKIYKNGKECSITKAGSSTVNEKIVATDGEKSLGYNGPSYSNAYAKFTLDEYKQYKVAASAEDIIYYYEEFGDEFDKKAIAQSDVDAVSLLTSVSSNVTLPSIGALGTVFTWSSDKEGVLSSTGEVNRPEAGQEDVIVTLTLKGSYLGSEEVERTFDVTVLTKKDLSANLIPTSIMGDVILDDAYLSNAAEKEDDYLLSMNSKKFLFEFYRVAGLDPVAESGQSAGYEGWERNYGNNFRSHTFGHYMSAVSQAYLSSNDATKKEKLFKEAKDAVEGLKKCQDSYTAKWGGDHEGYISAFPEAWLQNADGIVQQTEGKGDGNVYVPYYNLHKVVVGLMDIAKNIDDTEIKEMAMEVVSKYGEYFYNRFQKLGDNKSKLLIIEYGGMNDAFYELYRLTGNNKFKEVAQYFDETALFTQLAAGKDVLEGKHANTMIPKLIGALKRYQTLIDDESDNVSAQEKAELESLYLKAAKNFWDIVIKDHTYVTGGNSQAEHFRKPGKLYQYAMQTSKNEETCETCNVYNMLKLSQGLYSVTKDKKYLDYFENGYLNAIVSSQNPETGTTMYFQPMAPGYNKVFNRPHDEFWCCTGTGMENFSKLGDYIYMTEGSTVYVNMFFSSKLNNNGMSLVQEANMPTSDTATYTILSSGMTLKLRKPDWLAGEPTITINGDKKDLVEENGFYVLENLSMADEVTYKTPMEVVPYDTQDNANFVAFKYGPTVLSAGLGSNNIDASQSTGILVRSGTLDSSAQTTITIQNSTVKDWMDNVAENVVRIDNDGDDQVQFKLENVDTKSQGLVFTPHYRRYDERYGLYMIYEEPDSADAQKRILENKELLRDEEISVDYLYSFDGNNYEASKNNQGEDTSVGTYSGKSYRHATNNGWFSYDLAVDDTAEKNYLNLTFYSGDRNRKFDIIVDGELLSTYTIHDNQGTNVFYIETFELPNELVEGKEKITIRFQGGYSSFVGGLYGISITTGTAFGSDATLKNMEFDKGVLTPEFDGALDTYMLLVPKETESVGMDVTPNVPSGLIYVNNILIDDTLTRYISLENDVTNITLVSKAQDHQSATTYQISIIKGDGGDEVGDKTELIKLINSAPAVEEKDNYSSESWATYTSALEEAIAVRDKEGATEIEVNVIYAKLKNAIDGLREKHQLSAHYDMSHNGDKLLDISGKGRDATLIDVEEKDFSTFNGEDILDFNKKGYATLPKGVVTDSAFTIQTTISVDIAQNHWAWVIGDGFGTWAANNVGNYIFVNPKTNDGSYKNKLLSAIKTGGRSNESRVPVSTSGNDMDTVKGYVTITLVSEEGKLTLYVNGNKISELSHDHDITDIIPTGDIVGYIGKSLFTNDPLLDATISDMKIWDSSLNAEEVNSELPTDADLSKMLMAEIIANMLDKNVSTDDIVENLNFINSIKGVAVTWKETSEPNIISNTGVVTQPSDTDKYVSIPVEFTLGETKFEKDIVVVVPKVDAEALLNEMIDSLDIHSKDDVRGNIYLPTSLGKGSTIKWTTSHPEIVEVEATELTGYDDVYKEIPAGVITRPDSDVRVTMTATIALGNRSKKKDIEIIVRKKAKELTEEDMTDYFFTYFSGEAYDDGENVFFATSEDGLNWQDLNNNQAILTSAVGEKGIRDPHIIRSPEGDKFYIVATDLRIKNGNGWTAAQQAGSQCLLVWESTDLVNWSDVRRVEVSAEIEAGCTWAPETSYDPITGEYIVYWSSKVKADNYAKQRVYYAKTRDFYNFTKPEVMIDLNQSSIDTTIIEHNGTYYRYTKNEGGSTNELGAKTKTIFLEKGETLLGDFQSVASETLNSKQWVEGPAIFKFNKDDKDIDEWCLLLDEFGGIGYYPVTINDLDTGIVNTVSESFKMPTRARHGTPITVTKAEYNRLVQQWGGEAVDKILLQELIEKEKAKNLNEDDYIKDTFDAYMTALTEGKTVLDKSSATSAEVSRAIENINNGINGLEKAKPQIDKTTLEAAINNAVKEADKDKYTEDSYDAYVEALNSAKAILAKEDASQAEVDKAAADLDAAKSKLVNKPEPVDKKKKAEEAIAEIKVPSSTTTDITLPLKGTNGTIFSWKSDSGSVLSATGKVNRPVSSVGDKKVTLTVTGVYDGGERVTKTFVVTVKAKDKVAMPFKDVKNADWFNEYVYKAYERGLIRGKSDTSFAPYDNISRAEFALILYRIEKEPTIAYSGKFPDVSKGIWYTDAVEWAASKGIVTGYTHNGKFDPAGSITREQMAVMMYRYCNYKNIEIKNSAKLTSYKDYKKISSFAQAAMEWAVGNEIITGKDNMTRLDPVGKATRAEAATILVRFVEKYE